MSRERDQWLSVALLAGAVALVGPRRTRPLAGFVYGLALSRGHGAGVGAWQDKAAEQWSEMFDERTGVWFGLAALRNRVQDLEHVVAASYGAQPDAQAIERVARRGRPAVGGEQS